MDGARLTRAERGFEGLLGALLIVFVFRSAAIVILSTLVGFGLTWLGLALSTNKRHRKSFTFDRRLLVTTILIVSLWTFFGFALGAGDRSDDPTTLPTLMSIGTSGSVLDAQTILLYGVLSAFGIAALLDGIRHARAHRSRSHGWQSVKRHPARRNRNIDHMQVTSEADSATVDEENR